MSRRLFLAVVALQMASVACAAESPSADLAAVSDRALSEDPAVASAAIAELRSAGPAGLAALFGRHRGLLDARAVATDLAERPEWGRLKEALDAVGAQRDCDTSRLYWHTDLPTAIDAARRERKPILSLRLLGKLTDEFSCANSRFFRTALYPNRKVGDYLRDHFVLHWQSVRPAPRVTIDFGDGRKLERTLTGNSIHYVLDSAGRPFDALPGLYGPQAFLRELKAIEAAVGGMAGLDDAARSAALVRYHQTRARAVEQAWRRDLAELKVPVPAATPPARLDAAKAPAGQRVDAKLATMRAAGKGFVQNPLPRAMALSASEALRQATTDDVWPRLGQLHESDATLDEASVVLIRRQNPGPAPDPLSCIISLGDERAAAMVRKFQTAMAADTVRNEYDLRRQLHEWLVAAPNVTLGELNDRVYAELFLTPGADPWLGLADPETYTGLENGGRRGD